MNPVDIVAEKSAEAHRKIKELRKILPQTNRAEKDEFERQAQELKDEWYEEVKHLLIKK